MRINKQDLLNNLGKMAVGSRLVIEQVQIPFRNLAPALEGFKIVQLSDFHVDSFTQIDLIVEAVASAKALKPDLIVLTGDYVSLLADAIFELTPLLAELDAKYGVFAIVGNHDVWTNVEAIRSGFQSIRLPLLHNEGLALDIGHAEIYLAGVDAGWGGQPDLNAALDDLPAEALTILLAHEPDPADQFSLDGRVSLQLSGHSHGGQIRLPGIGAPILPYLGRKYDHGLYKVNKTWLYTNRGIGFTATPVRMNCPPEITEFILCKA